MTLQDPNWMTFGGEPITGRTPTRVRVISSTPGLQLSGAQQAFVAQAYRAFCAGIRVSAIPNGYHARRSVGGDGTEVMMESNNGIHRMTVRIVGGGEATVQFEPSGIGVMVCYTSNALIPGYTLQRPGKANIAQPLILRPDKQGKWSVERAKHLAGGQAMWSSQDKKTWFSVNATAMPGGSGFFYSPKLVSEQIRYFNDDWTPDSNDRIVTSDYLGRLYGLRGRYVYRRNEAIAFLAAPFGGPPFIHSTPAGGSFLYHVWLDDWGAQVYVSRPFEGENLRSPDGVPAPYIGEDSDETPDFTNSYYLTSPRRMSFNTAAYSPAGDKITVLGFQSGGRSDYLITINFDGPSATISEESAGVESVEMQIAGQLQMTTETIRTFGVEESPVDYVYTSCDGTTAPQKLLSTSQTTASTITASYEGVREEVKLNRPVIGVDGATHLEVYSAQRTVAGNASFTVTDGRDGQFAGSYERSITTTLTSTTTQGATLTGPGYSFPVGLHLTRSIGVSGTRQVRSSATVSTNHSFEVDCTSQLVEHNVLYWDAILGARLTYRATASFAIGGALVGAAGSYSQSQVQAITTKTPAAAELVLVHGDTEITLATFAGSTGSYTPTLGLADNLFVGEANSVMDPLKGGLSASWLLGYTPASCPSVYGFVDPVFAFSAQTASNADPTTYYLSPCNFLAQSAPEDWADVSYNNLQATQEKAAVEDLNAFNAASTTFTLGVGSPVVSGVPSASDFYTQYARDPKTDAIVLSVRHPNSGQSWVYAITKQGVTDLREVLGLATAQQVKLDPTFPYNNLVSI